LACAYHLAPYIASCNPNGVTTNATGGSRAIALVDAYHYPYAQTNLTTFSTQFGLPLPTASNFQVVYASGVKPPTDPYGWEIEEALDLQWAHAMAPNAKLILVEAASNSNADLLLAVQKASALVALAGGGEVSMSWGGGEFPGETAFEPFFNTSKVVYFASSGDSPGTIWPCVSPNVVCVGGTSLRRNPANNNLFQEIAWSDGGSGISPYFARPPYQGVIAGIVGTQRGVPDVSLVADPNTGGWVRYSPSDNSGPGWYIVGGTSWSSPSFAGIVNSAGTFYLSSLGELYNIYAGIGTGNFRNISAGYCGPYVGWSATLSPQWDLCTGVGSDLGLLGK
jgi:kumamolisin